MASGDQVMRINGDFSNYIQGAKKAEEATGNIAKKAKGIGDAFSGSLIKVEMLKQATRKVLQALQEIRDDSVEGSRSYGQRQIDLRNAATSLGLSSPAGLRRAVEDPNGGSTVAGTMSFVEALAQQQKGAMVKLSSEDVGVSVGGFAALGEPILGKGGADFLEGIKNGERPQDALARLTSIRMKQDNHEAYAEIRLRKAEDAAQLAVDWKASGGDQKGAAARQFDADNKKENAGQDNWLNNLGYRYVPNWLQQKMAESDGWKYGENNTERAPGVLDYLMHETMGKVLGGSTQPDNVKFPHQTTPEEMHQTLKANAEVMKAGVDLDRHLMSRPNYLPEVRN